MIDDRQHRRIKGALELRGLSLSAIARELEVAPTSVSIVSRGIRRSRRIEEAIASAIGCAPEELWPDRYQPDMKKGEAAMVKA